MKYFTKEHFKTMPWKNGGGQTVELFRLPQTGDFLFRLSKSEVKQDGDFSLFPGIDRYLMILKGQGCELIFKDRRTLLRPQSAPFLFQGEESVFCKLLAGPLQDFNIMINRTWGEASVEINRGSQEEIHLNCSEDFLYVYNSEEDTLIELQKDESIKVLSTHLIITRLRLF